MGLWSPDMDRDAARGLDEFEEVGEPLMKRSRLRADQREGLRELRMMETAISSDLCRCERFAKRGGDVRSDTLPDLDQNAFHRRGEKKRRIR